LALLPSKVRTALVVVGGVFVAVGAEGGSLFSISESFRKDGRLHGWDAVGVIVSLLATLTTTLFAFATLTDVRATWTEVISVWGYVINTLFIVLDANFNFINLGLHLFTLKRDRIQSMRDELSLKKARIDIEERQRALKVHESSVSKSADVHESSVADSEGAVKGGDNSQKDSEGSQKIKANKRMFTEWAMSLNGGRQSLTVEDIEAWAKGNDYSLPTARTMYKWIRGVKGES